jgi:hypothetical protein
MDEANLIETKGNWRLAPKTFEDQQRLAKMYLESKVLPARFKNVAEIVTAMHFVSEHFTDTPLTALRQTAVIQGTPCFFGDLPLALCYRSGLVEMIDEKWEGEKGSDSYTATCTIQRKGQPLKIIRKFSIGDAKKAGLFSNSTYQKYTDRMIQMRSRSWALKDGFADVLAGISILEYDFNKTVDEIDVSPLSDKLEKLNSVSSSDTVANHEAVGT